MQSTLQIAETRSATGTLNPLALWHLLSLDAPTVAALWTWFVARAMHVRLTPAIPVAMFLAVWLLYAVDRLLDSRTNSPALEARHLFHRKHRRGFMIAIVVVVFALLAPLRDIAAATMRSYCVLAALLLVWLALIHLADTKKALPKEIVPGPFFAAAVFIPTHTSALPAAAAFALLCTLNCLSIYSWEHPSGLDRAGTPHLSTRIGARLLTPLALVTALLPLALIPASAPDVTPVLLAVALAAALLLALDRLKTRLEPTNLRAAADLVLLTPLLIAPFLR